MKQVYIRQEDYSDSEKIETSVTGCMVYGNLPRRKLERHKIDPSYGRVFYVDYGFAGDAFRMFKSVRLRIPQYLVNYFYSLELTLLHSMIQNVLKENQKLFGFSLQDITFDKSAKEWIYQLNTICSKKKRLSFYESETCLFEKGDGCFSLYDCSLLIN